MRKIRTSRLGEKKGVLIKKISEIFAPESFVYNKNKSFLNYMIGKAINTVLILDEIKKVKLIHQDKCLIMMNFLLKSTGILPNLAVF